MFGLKIISKCQYDLMQGHIEDLTEQNLSLRNSLDECKANAKELYDENASLNDSVEKLRSINAKRKDEIEDLKERHRGYKEAIKELNAKRRNINFEDHFRLSVCDNKCTGCKNEQTDCKKYVVGDKTVCILRKEPSFPDSEDK